MSGSNQLPADLNVGNGESRNLSDKIVVLLPALGVVRGQGFDARCVSQVICGK